MKLHIIVWNTCGNCKIRFLVRVYVCYWKSSRVYFFLGQSVRQNSWSIELLWYGGYSSAANRYTLH